MQRDSSAMRTSIHDLAPDRFNYVWDNGLPAALEVESGDVVELHVRDASDEQISESSGVDAVSRLDFAHVNPVSGPIFVKGSRPGDVLAVELVEFKPRDWGWTAIIPGFGLLADEFADPWLRISRVDEERGRVAFAPGITLPYRPFPGTIGVALAEPGAHPIVPPSRFGGNMDIKHLVGGTTLYLPVGVDGALFSLGVRYGGRDRDGRHRATLDTARLRGRCASVRAAASCGAGSTRHRLVRVHRCGP